MKSLLKKVVVYYLLLIGVFYLDSLDSVMEKASVSKVHYVYEGF